MSKLFYPDFGRQFNIFLRGNLVAREIPLPRITPRGNNHTRADKIELVARYLQEICILNKPPEHRFMQQLPATTSATNSRGTSPYS